MLIELKKRLAKHNIESMFFNLHDINVLYILKQNKIFGRVYENTITKTLFSPNFYTVEESFTINIPQHTAVVVNEFGKFIKRTVGVMLTRILYCFHNDTPVYQSEVGLYD